MVSGMKVNPSQVVFWLLVRVKMKCVCDLHKEVEKFPPIPFHVGDTATDARAEMGWERTVVREEAVS